MEGSTARLIENSNFRRPTPASYRLGFEPVRRPAYWTNCDDANTHANLSGREQIAHNRSSSVGLDVGNRLDCQPSNWRLFGAEVSQVETIFHLRKRAVPIGSILQQLAETIERIRIGPPPSQTAADVPSIVKPVVEGALQLKPAALAFGGIGAKGCKVRIERML